MHFRGADSFQNPFAFPRGRDRAESVRRALLSEMIKARGGLRPETIRQTAQIQLKGSEGALNAETVAVEADNRGWVEVQICTNKDNALSVIFRKDKTDFPVQSLPQRRLTE